MNSLIAFFLSFFSGYTFFHFFSHPGKKKNILPHIKFKNIELLPNLKIHFRRTTIHVHHWIILATLTITSLIIIDGFSNLLFVKGAAIGGIVQGLRFKDRFRFRNRRMRLNSR